MFLVCIVAKYLRNETLCLVSKGIQSKSVVIFDYFGPFTLGHSFQCSPKVLKNELLLAVGIVIVIAEPLETLLHRYAFFEEHDKDKGYAGLCRVADEDGTAVWTLLKETEVAAQLERRARERHEEEQRHEKIFSDQARSPSGQADAVETLRAELNAARETAATEVETLRAELKAAREEATAATPAPTTPTSMAGRIAQRRLQSPRGQPRPSSAAAHGGSAIVPVGPRR